MSKTPVGARFSRPGRENPVPTPIGVLGEVVWGAHVQTGAASPRRIRTLILLLAAGLVLPWLQPVEKRDISRPAIAES